MEMSLFYDHPKGVGLITNLINRLKILLMEDLSLGETFRINEGIKLLDQYDQDRSQRHILLEFCDLVIEGRKNRITSYMNCWWRFQDYELHITNKLDLNKISKYKKEGDTDELLLLGENLILRLENKEENIFQIFNEMMKIDVKCGPRYRRTEACYLWFEILQDYMDTRELKDIFHFGLQMFMRKGMKERPAFGIWLGIIVWKRESLDYSVKDRISFSEDDFNDYRVNMTKIEIDDYVIEDYHVNKGFGLGKFAEVGAFVKDEDLSLLTYGQEYKQFYIDTKHQSGQKPKKTEKTKKILKTDKTKKIKDEKFGLERLSFDFTDVKVLQEGVCGGKVCCIMVNYEGKKYILKEMGKSMNWGLDYLLVDECKSYFDLWSMNMKRIVGSKKLIRKDPKIKSFVNNWIFDDQEAIYTMMDHFENIGDLGKNKEYLKDEFTLKECLKIRLFDGIFRSSDNILRNILVDKSGELLSIDEGDIYGKRGKIFNHNDWCQKKNINDEILNEVLNDVLSESVMKKRLIKKKMIEYGHEDKISEFENRFDNYKEIVNNEWSFN
jgi:hypothetical protein